MKLLSNSKHGFLLLLLINLFLTNNLFASDIEMADLMRSNGMIYVVVGVLSIIFAGILVFLFLIERRLKKLEKSKNKL